MHVSQHTQVQPATIADPTVFAPHSLVAVEHNEQRLHARVLATKKTRGTLSLRPERWAEVEGFPESPSNSDAPWTFPPDSEVRIASATLGNNLDFIRFPPLRICPPLQGRQPITIRLTQYQRKNA